MNDMTDPFAEFRDIAPRQETIGNVTYHHNLEQGSEEWLQARLGILTASEMKMMLGKTLKPANNDKTRAHTYELLAQRINQHVEPSFLGDDMIRGNQDEILARDLYAERVAEVKQVGFITNDKWGFTLGYSPDGLVGDNGLIEIKSRRQKFQAETLVKHYPDGTVPDEFLFQCQTALLVSEREYLDFISYCGGMPMCVIRVFPDAKIHQAIIEVAEAFESQVKKLLKTYRGIEADDLRLFPTERHEFNEEIQI